MNKTMTDAEIDLARVRKLRAGDAAEIALLRKALNAMLTEMGMDENEYNKPTFDQARRALGHNVPSDRLAGDKQE